MFIEKNLEKFIAQVQKNTQVGVVHVDINSNLKFVLFSGSEIT
jgi:hypothetical protein